LLIHRRNNDGEMLARRSWRAGFAIMTVVRFERDLIGVRWLERRDNDHLSWPDAIEAAGNARF